MGFLQIITFTTDRFEEFHDREQQWVRDSLGKRTSVGGQFYADRTRPGHYVALDWFDSYESAMVNSQLPETDAFARDAMSLATGEVVFHNLEPAMPEWNNCEDGLRTSLETSSAAEHTFADDVDLDLLVPHGRMRSSGIAALEQALREEAPGRDIELWEAHATFDGFVVEYAYRTHGTPSLAAGIVLATLRDGRIARLAITCAGNWSAETEARVVAETGALGPRVVEVVPVTADTVDVTGAVTERLFGSLLGALELATVHLGVRLGLYDALATPRTAAGLAAAAGIDERYAREWLEQQAISGLVTVTEPGDGDHRVYGLDPEQAASFGDPESPAYAGSMALLMGGVGKVVDALPEVYRVGGGIPFGGYGDDVRIGQGLFNRAGFLGQLTQEWLPVIPGVADLLSRPGARALDLGCGVGFSSIALAAAYPGLAVLGVDSDDASVMDARSNSVEAGVGDRVRFEVADAAAPLAGDGFDVAFYFEALHDMAHPVESLTAVREALRPGGVVVVMDERAEEEFAPGGSEVERLLATASVLHCLPVGRSQPGSEGTGALFRPSTMRSYAARAGFAHVEVAPVEHDLFRFFVLRP